MALRFYFLLATILTLPFAIRKVLWVEQNSFFNEYRDISIYAFEVFLIGYVLCSLLQHKIYLKSILKKVFHVEHLLILLILGISTIVSAFFDQEYQGLYFYIRWLTYFVFSFFLYKDLKLIVPRGTVDNSDQNCSTWNIPLLNKYLKLFHVEHSPSTQITSHCSTWNNLLYIVGLSLLFQAILIICQFIKQQSLGLIYLGESILHPAIAGVATIIVSNIEILRGYGTFLHPNIAAFFFLVYGIAYILLSIVPRGTLNNENCSTWNIPFLKKWQKLFHVEHFFSQELTKIVPRGTIWLLLGVILLGFILTFSKSVIGLVIILAILWYFLANCSTWNIQSRNKGIQLFHVEHSKSKQRDSIVPRGTIIISLVIIVIVWFGNRGLPEFLDQSILERKLQYLSIPVNSPIELLIGEGLGSYTNLLAKKSPGLYLWQLQPLHNVYLLAITEIGLLPILGISVYMWLKWRKNFFKSLKKILIHQKIVIFIAAELALLLVVDHYTWDIEQGQLLFVLLVTILAFAYNYALPKNRE